MGLLDFLKKNNKEEKSDTDSIKPVESSVKYLGDLDKTKIISRLCDIPRDKRDGIWQKELLKNIVGASFQCGKPQIILGPDEMRYFQLLISEPNKEFECFVIEHMINDYLLENGLGVVLNANKSEPDWVLSYGDIVNYSLNKEFLTANSLFLDQRKSDEILTTEQRVRVGQPSESIIPLQARKVVREYLGSFGIIPKICLMEWIDKENKFDIVFTTAPSMFSDKEHFKTIMGSVKWFFPRHYSIVCKDENKDFELL
jgi:hypothetical protein